MKDGVKRYEPASGHDSVMRKVEWMRETDGGGWVIWDDYDALLVELGLLREALNFSCKSLCNVTSSDGSGHADIALGVLRLAGVGADEREALVEGWKANVQWRIDNAMRKP